MHLTLGVQLLLGLVVVMITSSVFGALAEKLGQPAVVGEIIGGIFLGSPLFHGAVANTLFPNEVRPSLVALANLGVVVFVFGAALEMDRTVFRRSVAVAGVIAMAGTALPFVLGVGLGFLIVERHPGLAVTQFVLFLGTALAVTAFPVLVRILRAQQIQFTDLGVLATICAALADVIAWSMLAVVVATASIQSSLWLLLLVIPFGVLLFVAVRPLLNRLITTMCTRRTAMVVLLAGLLLCSAVTEILGLHLIFGAFLFGLVAPRAGVTDGKDCLSMEISRFNEYILLPVFFVVSGLGIEFAALHVGDLVELALLFGVATIGKLAGTYAAARLCRISRGRSAALGVLMNTRGLTELIVLSVGRHLAILDGRLYTLLVVTAVATTVLTSPLLRVIRSTSQWPRRTHAALSSAG